MKFYTYGPVKVFRVADRVIDFCKLHMCSCLTLALFRPWLLSPSDQFMNTRLLLMVFSREAAGKRECKCYPKLTKHLHFRRSRRTSRLWGWAWPGIAWLAKQMAQCRPGRPREGPFRKTFNHLGSRLGYWDTHTWNNWYLLLSLLIYL